MQEENDDAPKIRLLLKLVLLGRLLPCGEPKKAVVISKEPNEEMYLTPLRPESETTLGYLFVDDNTGRLSYKAIVDDVRGTKKAARLIRDAHQCCLYRKSSYYKSTEEYVRTNECMTGNRMSNPQWQLPDKSD